MKSILANSDPIVTFIHQMIPHHQNAVNMAKAVLKTNTLDASDENDLEMEHMMWAIINGQNFQIHQMQDYLAAKDYVESDICEPEASAPSPAASRPPRRRRRAAPTRSRPKPRATSSPRSALWLACSSSGRSSRGAGAPRRPSRGRRRPATPSRPTRSSSLLLLPDAPQSLARRQLAL